MKKKISDLFQKKPGERMPNLLGWLVIIAFDLAVVGLIVLTMTVTGMCSGCATSRITRHTPMGDVTATSSTTPFTSDYSEDFNSDADYERCIEVSHDLMALYRVGRVINWAEFSSIQQTCFTQTAGFCMPDWRIDGIPSGVSFGPSAAMCGGGSGAGGFGGYGALGYSWTSPPTLNPYVRSAR
ncbi:hypothetical protein K8R04_03975 [Candidatus Uhrbacteria bacterium]|nr:hypothetical protein [Candidatus Uhrbacteria bacterium]